MLVDMCQCMGGTYCLRHMRQQVFLKCHSFFTGLHGTTALKTVIFMSTAMKLDLIYFVVLSAVTLCNLVSGLQCFI
jgi:hypothetical protein